MPEKQTGLLRPLYPLSSMNIERHETILSLEVTTDMAINRLAKRGFTFSCRIEIREHN